MIFAPGSLLEHDSASSAVTKSPGTNSPVSSMKKQRSASPSKATPRSAFSSSTLPTMNSRFSGSSGFGSWFGKRPVGLEEAAHGVESGSRSRTGGSIAPAIPFAASITTLSGLIACDVDEGEDPLDVGRPDVVLLDLSRRAARGLSPAQRAVADLQQPGVAADRQRAAADDLHARVLLRVVRGGDRDAAVELELADREIDHLRADEPDVEHVGARRRPHPGSAASAIDGDERRMSRPTAIRAGSNCLDVGAPDRVGAVLVELRPGRCRGRRMP